jgi:FkbM family methyltransferase
MLLFDIGANLGRWANANVQDDTRILAVEASSKTFKLLQENCIHPNIHLLQYAVCNNECKDTVFYDSEICTLSTLNKDWLCSETSRFCNTPFNEVICKTITLDKLIEEYGIPDLLKIDVEGGEADCIASLSTKVPLLCFEWASETNSVTFESLAHLQGLGYTNFYIQNGDDYTFRPDKSMFQSYETVHLELERMIPRVDWGMIWCM